jgi:hypothetical protein
MQACELLGRRAVTLPLAFPHIPTNALQWGSNLSTYHVHACVSVSPSLFLCPLPPPRSETRVYAVSLPLSLSPFLPLCLTTSLSTTHLEGEKGTWLDGGLWGGACVRARSRLGE